jgi:hypothetical protein
MYHLRRLCLTPLCSCPGGPWLVRCVVANRNAGSNQCPQVASHSHVCAASRMRMNSTYQVGVWGWLFGGGRLVESVPVVKTCTLPSDPYCRLLHRQAQHTGRQAGRHEGRQIDRLTDIQTDRQRGMRIGNVQRAPKVCHSKQRQSSHQQTWRQNKDIPRTKAKGAFDAGI